MEQRPDVSEGESHDNILRRECLGRRINVFTFEDAFEAGQWLSDREESKEERSEGAVLTK